MAPVDDGIVPGLPDAEIPTTLWTLLEPIDLGETAISNASIVASGKSHRFGFDLIAGHPRTAVVEDRLAQAWRDSLSGDVGGLKKTNWLTQFQGNVSDHYDFLFVDLGPSLGALNRSALLAADYFVSPMGADVFSVIGLRNIAEWLHGAVEDYEQSIMLCEKRNPGRLEDVAIRKDIAIRNGFAGYTVQSYIAKYKGGERRPTIAYEKIISNFPLEVEKYLGDYAADTLATADFKLGEIPNMYSLVPLSQNANAPISELKSADGLVGSHYVQSERYGGIVDEIALRLLKNVGAA
jgi:cellulose biosynthesis protein BcsQ